MRFGVTYAALLANGVLVMELFLVTRNLLALALAAPIHGVCMLLCARDARVFELLGLWLRARLPAARGALRYWRAGSVAPLRYGAPTLKGRRRARPEVLL